VGKGAANKFDDVVLVQHFLRNIYRYGDLTPPESKPLSVDGICGKHTRLWILSFQKLCRKIGLSVALDGQISPARGIFSKAGTVYTILHLNASYMARYPDLFKELVTNPRALTNLTMLHVPLIKLDVPSLDGEPLVEEPATPGKLPEVNLKIIPPRVP
jgi:hypothetical protein